MYKYFIIQCIVRMLHMSYYLLYILMVSWFEIERQDINEQTLFTSRGSTTWTKIINVTIKNSKLNVRKCNSLNTIRIVVFSIQLQLQLLLLFHAY